MTDFKLLPIPAEDYDDLGISPDAVIETCVIDDGALIVRVIRDEDFDNFICGNDCECCPMNGGTE